MADEHIQSVVQDPQEGEFWGEMKVLEGFRLMMSMGTFNSLATVWTTLVLIPCPISIKKKNNFSWVILPTLLCVGITYSSTRNGNGGIRGKNAQLEIEFALPRTLPVQHRDQ